MVELERQFGSDNHAGICPEVWAALEEANRGHAGGYGDDPWTARAVGLIRDLFETDCEVFFVFNGTAANALGLAGLCSSYHSILCHRTAHVEMDECGAPAFFTGGAKVLRVEGDGGKVDPGEVRRVALERRGDVHCPQARALTVTQATEVGTVYTAEELAVLGGVCRELGLGFHMDGARFANAVESTGRVAKELTWKAGVDVLSFGGTKNGIGLGEAVVFFDRARAREFGFRRKQAGQLASKMRFLSAPWIGLLSGGAWLRRAGHANAMAQYLARGLGKIEGVRVLYPVEANAVFVRLPEGRAEAAWAEGWKFYEFPACGGHRLMCAWDTRREDVDRLLAVLGRLH